MAFPKKLSVNTAAATGGGALGIPFQYTMPAGFRAAGGLMTDGGISDGTYTGISTYGERFVFGTSGIAFCGGGRGVYGPSMRSDVNDKVYAEFYFENIGNTSYTWFGAGINPSLGCSTNSYLWRASSNIVRSSNCCTVDLVYGSFAQGDTISIAFNGSAYAFYKNGSSMGTFLNSSLNYSVPIVMCEKYTLTVQCNLQGA